MGGFTLARSLIQPYFYIVSKKKEKEKEGTTEATKLSNMRIGFLFLRVVCRDYEENSTLSSNVYHSPHFQYYIYQKKTKQIKNGFLSDQSSKK